MYSSAAWISCQDKHNKIRPDETSFHYKEKPSRMNINNLNNMKNSDLYQVWRYCSRTWSDRYHIYLYRKCRYHDAAAEESNMLFRIPSSSYPFPHNRCFQFSILFPINLLKYPGNEFSPTVGVRYSFAAGI